MNNINLEVTAAIAFLILVGCVGEESDSTGNQENFGSGSETGSAEGDECEEITSSGFRRTWYSECNDPGNCSGENFGMQNAYVLDDFDGDGKDELFFAAGDSPVSRDWAILREDNTMEESHITSNCDAEPDPYCGTGYFMNAADIDNDGVTEVINLVPDSNSSNATYAIVINNVDSAGNATFRGSTKIEDGRFAMDIKVGDVNNDGFVDLLVYKTTSEDCEAELAEAKASPDKIKCSVSEENRGQTQCPEGMECVYQNLSSLDEQYCMPLPASQFIDGDGGFRRRWNRRYYYYSRV